MSRLSKSLAAAIVAVVAVSSAAFAAPTTHGIASWTDLVGTSTDYTTTMQLPATGFPAASVTSTSRAGSVGVQSGSSNWFGENSSVGLKYGSSKDRQYLNLRPKADNASDPSVTTYTFERPTPQGWALVLGDVDADQVHVSATTASGAAATVSELGFQEEFNFCATSPKPSACSGVVAPFDTPVWDPATQTLVGNAGAADTTGAAGWFEPTTSLKTLTLTFTRRAGFPIYQTWFAVNMNEVTGTVGVTSGSCDVDALTVQMLDAGGDEVAQTATAADGTYSFTGVAASAGYSIKLATLPPDCDADGPTSQAVDLTAGDAVADFAVREHVASISGVVSDSDGAVAGVDVVLLDSGGAEIDRMPTGPTGSYQFDGVPPGDYDVTIPDPGAGYRVPDSEAVSVDHDDVSGIDFLLVRPGTIAGSVSGDKGPVEGVKIELEGPGSAAITVETDATGAFSVDDLDPGDYVVRLLAPSGTEAVGNSRGVTGATAPDGWTMTVMVSQSLVRH